MMSETNTQSYRTTTRFHNELQKNQKYAEEWKIQNILFYHSRTPRLKKMKSITGNSVTYLSPNLIHETVMEQNLVVDQKKSVH